MHNMLIRPTEEELANFGEPDYTIYNAGAFPCNRATEGMTSGTSVTLNFASREVVILGTQYAGEMKKGVFTIMNYLLPKRGILSMHASANEGKDGDVTVFFGLSGTGKTTLSADENRLLIGDDEHAWTDKGIFNIEGGCYAKAIGLTREKEPEIWDAIRFGALLENVVFDQRTGQVDYEDGSITENTRVSYPLEYIPNVKIPAVGGHPKNIIMLPSGLVGNHGNLDPYVYVSVDVVSLPSQLTVASPSFLYSAELLQAMYHFISGYTAKVAGTEMGITEPTVWHPAKYAELLADNMAKHHVNAAWLINTGWTGGGFGSGHRMSLKDTRAIIDAIHSGDLAKAQPPGLQDEFNKASEKLAQLFKDNFKKFESGCSEDIRAAAPSRMIGLVLLSALLPPSTRHGGSHVVDYAHTVEVNIEAEVAWAISCRNDGGKVAEECFQHTPLRSVGDASWIAFVNGPRTAIPRTTVRVGGCEWVRNPVPARKMCSRSRMAEVGHLLGHVVARGKTVLIPARPGPVLVVPADLEPGDSAKLRRHNHCGR
ncbi:pckA [Symbiodinium natans]|uniref:phosphoenolpyruvate carboxykinase (ATP) n=1 Tax=Symbiodinium natans TaxID=878477 RepID=A0A812V0P1_9DINO|nr:pckA [Symbiodinium natans]